MPTNREDDARRAAALAAARSQDEQATREAAHATDAQRAAELRRIADELETLPHSARWDSLSRGGASPLWKVLTDLLARALCFGAWSSDTAAQAAFRRAHYDGCAHAFERLVNVPDLRRLAPGLERRSEWFYQTQCEIALLVKRLRNDADRLAAGAAADLATAESAGEGANVALTRSEVLVMQTMGKSNGSQLLSVKVIASEMNLSERLSERTIGEALRRLIRSTLAERPEGPRKGARLTIKGRRHMRNIAD